MRVTAWKDKRVLHLLATNTTGKVTSVRRRQKDGSLKDIPCPEAVQLYNAYMNGVDHTDQLRSSYNTGRKALKWWKYLFHFLLDICLVNAFILMRESYHHQQKTSSGRIRPRKQLDFRMRLAHQMLDSFCGKRKRVVEPMTIAPAVQHWPTVTGKRRVCKMCAQNGKRSEPVTACEQCQVHLCIMCFKPYHIALIQAEQ